MQTTALMMIGLLVMMMMMMMTMMKMMLKTTAEHVCVYACACVRAYYLGKYLSYGIQTWHEGRLIHGIYYIDDLDLDERSSTRRLEFWSHERLMKDIMFGVWSACAFFPSELLVSRRNTSFYYHACASFKRQMKQCSHFTDSAHNKMT